MKNLFKSFVIIGLLLSGPAFAEGPVVTILSQDQNGQIGILYEPENGGQKISITATCGYSKYGNDPILEGDCAIYTGFKIAKLGEKYPLYVFRATDYSGRYPAGVLNIDWGTGKDKVIRSFNILSSRIVN
jgi:hypothetical protein